MPTRSTTTAGRLARAAVVAFLLSALALQAVPASAAGTGGIEISPVPAVRDGKPVTSFRVGVPSRGAEAVPFSIRNVDDVPRSAEVYVAEVTRDGGGTFAVGVAGTSRYVSYRQRTVTLAPGEVRMDAFQVQAPDGERPDGTVYAAVVIEVRSGSIVQRAATLVRLTSGRTVPLPLRVVLVAGALVVLVAAGLLVARRRRPPAETA